MDKLQLINKLAEEIRDLEHFIHTLDIGKPEKRGNGLFDTNAIITKKELKSVSIFGSRYFGAGTHEQSITVPNTMIIDLVKLAKTQLRALQTEYNSYLK